MVALRQSYEKRGRPGGVRRGREPGVPLGVYHELDEAFRQLDGLKVLVGATREALVVAGAGGAVGETPPPSTGGNPPTVIKEVRTATLLQDAAYAQQARSATFEASWPTRILLVSVLLDVQGATATIGKLIGTVDGSNILRTLNDQSWTGGNGSLGQPNNVTGALKSTETVYQPKSKIIFGINRIASNPNLKIQTILTIEEHVTVG